MVTCLYHPLKGPTIIDESEQEKLIASGEYYIQQEDAMWKKYIFHEVIWTTIQAARLFAGENPDTTRLPTERYLKIFKAMEDDYLLGKLALEERKDFKGDRIFLADHKVFIKWVIARKFIIPAIFVTYIDGVSINVVQSVDALGHKDSIDLETGRKVNRNLREFSKKGVQAIKQKADVKWQPLLDLAFKKAKGDAEKGNKTQASQLAKLVVKEGRFIDINPNTFRKKISQDDRIKPYLISN